jgi:MFS family permease
VVLGSVGMQLLLSGLWVQLYGTYAAIWRSEFGWSKTTLALAYALQRIESGLLGPIQGYLVQRFGSRTVVRVGVLLLGGGLLGIARVTDLGTFIAMALVVGVGLALMGMLTLTAAVVNWFDRQRATALAVMGMGMSIGGLVIPLLAWLILAVGWRTTATLSGLLVLTAGLALSYLIRNDPESRGLRPDGVAAEAPVTEVLPSFTAFSALRTRAFWFLGLGHAFAVMGVSAVLVHLVVYLTEEGGFALTHAAAIFSLMTAFSLAGQLLGGVMGDRFDKRKMAAGAMLGQVAALALLASGTGRVAVVLFAAIQGLAWGGRAPLMSALRADYFGRASFASILGYSSMIIMAGSMIGPIVLGAIADSTDSYRSGFALLALIALLGAGMFWFATPPARPERQELEMPPDIDRPTPPLS